MARLGDEELGRVELELFCLFLSCKHKCFSLLSKR